MVSNVGLKPFVLWSRKKVAIYIRRKLYHLYKKFNRYCNKLILSSIYFNIWIRYNF
jgi:hypothetical protein